MQCKIRRTMFDLFVYYNCNNCIYKKDDEHFNYNKSFFHLYYIFSTCEISRESQELIFYDIKIKRFIYDAIYYDKEIIFLLLEENELKAIYNYLEVIGNFNKDIQIVII